eukprot:Hpha_TRINITY_DN15173_c1_g1::TRINITY_DN15173_c1_g1_i1::g.129128::m.129128
MSMSRLFFATSLAATCAAWSVTNLDDPGINWGFFEDGGRHPEYSAAYANSGSDLTFWGDANSLDYSMIHFYKNAYLPTTEQADCAAPAQTKSFCFKTKFSYGVASDLSKPTDPATTYDQPTAFNNECLPGQGCWTSKIQAIEFSASRWECGKRNEVAMQWCNVCARDGDWHSGVPVWRYYNAGWKSLPNSCGVTEAMSRLAHNQLHDFELCGTFDGTQTQYTVLKVGGTTLDLSACTPPVAVVNSHEGKLLAAAIQHDGTKANHAFRVHVQDTELHYN